MFLLIYDYVYNAFILTCICFIVFVATRPFILDVFESFLIGCWLFPSGALSLLYLLNWLCVCCCVFTCLTCFIVCLVFVFYVFVVTI